MQIDYYYILSKDEIIIGNDRFSQCIQGCDPCFTWGTNDQSLERIFYNELFFNEGSSIYQEKILWIFKEVLNYEMLYI